MKKVKDNRDTREIIAYSLLPFGTYTITTLISTALNLYFTDVLGLSMGMISIILTVSKIWDGINDPLMGSIVERTRTKWGKCRPYLLWTPIPLAFGVAILFAPVNFSGNGNFVYAFCAYILYFIFITALDIPAQGLVPLVFPENKKRVKAISIGNILGSLGTVLPSVLFFTIAGLWGRGNEKQGYFWTCVIFAASSVIFVLLSFKGVKEKVYIPPRKVEYKRCLKIVFSNYNMRVLVVAAFFTAAINVGGIFLPYFAKWNCIGVLPVDKLTSFISDTVGINISLTSEGLLIPLLQIGSGIAYMLSMALIPPLLKYTTKKKLWIYVSVIGAIADVVTYIIGVYVIPYNTTVGAAVYTALRFFTNFPVGMSTVLLVAMFSDITDEIEMTTGERLEGTVFSFKSLVNKISLAGFNAFILNVVAHFGYNAEKMSQITDNLTKPLIVSPTQASIIGGVNYTTLLNTIFFMLTVFGAIGLILQAVTMMFYKNDEKAMQAQIAEYRETKKAQMQQELDEALSKAE